MFFCKRPGGKCLCSLGQSWLVATQIRIVAWKLRTVGNKCTRLCSNKTLFTQTDVGLDLTFWLWFADPWFIRWSWKGKKQIEVGKIILSNGKKLMISKYHVTLWKLYKDIPQYCLRVSENSIIPSLRAGNSSGPLVLATVNFWPGSGDTWFHNCSVYWLLLFSWGFLSQCSLQTKNLLSS